MFVIAYLFISDHYKTRSFFNRPIIQRAYREDISRRTKHERREYIFPFNELTVNLTSVWKLLLEVKFVDIFREDEESRQFVWYVGEKRYSLEVDAKEAVVFFTHLHTTRIFEFYQIEELKTLSNRFSLTGIFRTLLKIYWIHIYNNAEENSTTKFVYEQCNSPISTSENGQKRECSRNEVSEVLSNPHEWPVSIYKRLSCQSRILVTLLDSKKPDLW